MKKGQFILGIILMISTIIGVGYILIWWGIISPIITVATAIDTGTVTASLIGWQIIYFLLRGVVATIVGFVGYFLTMLCFAR